MWQRVRALCTADLAHRMEQFADGGLARVLGNLHPDLCFTDDLLQIDKPHHCSHRLVSWMATARNRTPLAW